MDIQEFIRVGKVKMDVEPTDKNLNAPGWKGANHYKLLLWCKRKRTTIYYSQGLGIKEEPDLLRVLECLQLDCNVLMEEYLPWCQNMGLEPYCESTRRTYRACARNAKKLRRLFGEEGFHYFMRIYEWT